MRVRLGAAPWHRSLPRPDTPARRVIRIIRITHHSHAQPSILAWAQDCHTQSWRGQDCPLNPGVGTGLPWCFPENAGSAVLYNYARLAARIARKTPAVRRCTPMHLDSPPRLPAKLRKRTAVLQNAHRKLRQRPTV